MKDLRPYDGSNCLRVGVLESSAALLELGECGQRLGELPLRRICCSQLRKKPQSDSNSNIFRQHVANGALDLYRRTLANCKRRCNQDRLRS